MKLSLAISILAAAASVSVQAQNVVEVAVSLNETFSTLVDLVVAAELDEALATTEDITVFAPTNDAFAVLSDAAPDVVQNLLTEPWKLHLQNVLLYHVVPSVVPAAAVTDGLVATTLNGENITLTVPSEGNVVINDNSDVVQADVSADNGLIHVVDEVLLPSWVSNSIADRVIATSVLSTLVDLVVQAELVDTLTSGGPFTVFAPTDDSFVQALESIERSGVPLPLNASVVTTILTYHVVEGIYPASAITDGAELETLQGEMLSFTLSDDGAFVNEQAIVATDILANNGIVHVIGGVLLPEEVSGMLGGDFEVPPTMTTPPGSPTLSPNTEGTEAAGARKAARVFGALVAVTFFALQTCIY